MGRGKLCHLTLNLSLETKPWLLVGESTAVEFTKEILAQI
jgi:hypothetical protein